MSMLYLSIQMLGKLAVIIGGGTVALRKLHTLQTSGATVFLVAPEIHQKIAAMQRSGCITVRLGNFIDADLEGAFLVVAATNDASLNEQICNLAHARGALVASADNSENGDCIFPALLRRGNLEIAVSTGGSCPTFAADVRDKIAENISQEYAAILEQLAEEREKLLTNGSSSTYNRQVLRSHAGRLLAELSDRKESMS